MSNLMLSEDFDEDSDLSISVDSPEKHVTAMESYVTFRVCTKVHIFLHQVVISSIDLGKIIKKYHVCFSAD